jgi:hypothetical protein
MGPDMARIHPFVQDINRFPLAGAVNSGDQNDHRKPGRLKEFKLGIEESFSKERNFFFVRFFVNLVSQLCGFEHVTLPMFIMVLANRLFSRANL